MVVGLKTLHQRPTLIILDDPEDSNNTKTAEAMEYNRRWFIGSLVPTRDPMHGRIVVIGTPQHENCIVETLAEISTWKTMRYKAIANLGNEEEEEALWEEWKSLVSLKEEMKTYEEMGRIDIFYREYQCQSVGGSSQLFKPEYVRYWDGHVTSDNDGNSFLNVKEMNGKVYDSVHTFPVSVFMGIDPASSISIRADYTVVFPVAVSKEEDIFCLPYWRGRATPMDVAGKIVQWYDTFRPSRTAVETTGYQEMIRDYLLRIKFIPGMEQKNVPRDSKSRRLEGLQPLFAQGKVYLQKNMTDFRDELLPFPKGKHDDIMDAFYYAVKRRFVPMHTEKKPETTYSYGDDMLRYFLGIGNEEDFDREDYVRGENGVRRRRLELEMELDNDRGGM
jgi:hypothetical protein